MRKLLVGKLAVVCLLAVACGDDVSPFPVAPAENDPAFEVTGLKSYLLVGNALTPGTDEQQLSVSYIGDEGAAPGKVELWLDGAGPTTLTRAQGSFTHTLDIAALSIGNHEILLSADGAATAFARVTFDRGHPLYIITTTDWDAADMRASSIQYQHQLHTNHPELLLTHFVGPYTFTDPALTDARRTVLADFVKEMRDTHGDEIGLHIHPYCNFVNTTTVPCRTEPSLAYTAGDTTGYTIVLASYTRSEFLTLLQAADALFATWGLGKPTSFRAGGWSAEIHTLQALADNGFVADTSANNWRRMEEWMALPGTSLYAWNMTHWSTINDTSQPYYPSEADIQAPGTPALKILEVPDNSIMVDYVTAPEMIDIFNANWPRGALAQPTQVSIGFHPAPGLTAEDFERLDAIMTEYDKYLASAGSGPVVYANLSDMVLVWPQ